mmetsp:Transcript_11521/g.24557  ORF Transcript_11521/g.24557 Transcript_11521/m.24557 type:complete len:510 (+) Transcript_11521:2-1531(+)
MGLPSTKRAPASMLAYTLLSLIAIICTHDHPRYFTASALSSHGPTIPNVGTGNHQFLSRRDALIGAVSTAAINSLALIPSAEAAPLEAESVDLAAFNAARTSGSSSGGATSAATPSMPNILGNSDKSKRKLRRAIAPSVDPSPLLSLRGGKGGKSANLIPRVGYSLYKTLPEQVGRCTSLALRCGVRHFDVATLYGSNAEVRKPLQFYLDNGFAGLTKKGYYAEEKAELLEIFDSISLSGEEHAVQTVGVKSKAVGPLIDGSAGRRARRDQLFVSHKLSNEEQSTDILSVKRRIKADIAELGVGYLDLVSIHSPLTDKARRMASYEALLELRDSGFVRSVGVCNYGLGPLKEIEDMVGDDVENHPAMNQLELSPFNQHSDVVKYCDENGIAIGCAAWSKLSGADGPSEGWAVVADLAKARGCTKAQLLVRWSMQKGYVCVPRSGCASKIERVAIAENSYGGVSSFTLSEEEMKVLDGLDVGYKAGKLGRRDGWSDDDVVGPEWDPTEFV